MDIYRIRYNFIKTQVMVLALVSMYAFLYSSSANNNILLFYSVWNSISYIWMFVKEMRYAEDFHIFQIFELVTAQFIGFSGINCYSTIISGEPITF